MSNSKGIAEDIRKALEQSPPWVLHSNAVTWLRSLLDENERLTAEMDERESIVKRKFKIKQESVDETMTENQQLRDELEQIAKYQRDQDESPLHAYDECKRIARSILDQYKT